MIERKQQEIFAKNLNEISFYFFFILGTIHLISGMLVVNEFFIKSAWLINRLLDIPFLIVTLIYIFSNIKLYFISKKIFNPNQDLIFIILFLFIAVTSFLLDLIFSNKIPN
jgi:hypothetical protein